MFRNKDLKKKMKDAANKQFFADKKLHEELMNKVMKSHSNKLKKIHANYRKEIEKIQQEHNEVVKRAEEERIDKYEVLLNEKTDEIKDLKEEVDFIKSRVKDYESAYDMYRGLRGHIVQMTRKMKQATDKVEASSGEIYQAFSELEDLSDFHLKKMRSLEPKIEHKMLGVADVEKPVELKVVKSK